MSRVSLLRLSQYFFLSFWKMLVLSNVWWYLFLWTKAWLAFLLGYEHSVFSPVTRGFNKVSLSGCLELEHLLLQSLLAFQPTAPSSFSGTFFLRSWPIHPQLNSKGEHLFRILTSAANSSYPQSSKLWSLPSVQKHCWVPFSLPCPVLPCGRCLQAELG